MNGCEIYRKEMKYPLSVMDYMRVQKRFLPYVQPDSHCGDTGYRVRSLYFDSAGDSDFLDILDGTADKKKIRLRFYPPDDRNILLEYKLKSGSDGVKRSISVTKDQAKQMINGEYSFLCETDDPLALILFSRLMTGGYHPKAVVEYNRMAYVYPVSNTRITYDSAITASHVVHSFFDIDPLMVPIVSADLGVLEVKYDHFLVGVLKEALAPLDSLISANSKYALSRFIF